MNSEFNESNRVLPTSEQIEWYVAHARQVRNEVILRGLKRAFSYVRGGFKQAVACLGDAFHSAAGKESGAHRPC